MGTEAFTTGAFSRGARGGDTTGLGHALANSDPGFAFRLIPRDQRPLRTAPAESICIGETGFLSPETDRPTFRPEMVSAETETQPQEPANCGLLGRLREICNFERLRGGLGRWGIGAGRCG